MVTQMSQAGRITRTTGALLISATIGPPYDVSNSYTASYSVLPIVHFSKPQAHFDRSDLIMTETYALWLERRRGTEIIYWEYKLCVRDTIYALY